MTEQAPASLSICALMSPVNAPQTAAWQSCPPMPIRPAAVRTAREISVAGVQIKTSASGRVSVTEAAIASISPSCELSPFIFQFPAINGRTLALILSAPSWGISQRGTCREHSQQYRR
jgi:hypothetical protein